MKGWKTKTGSVLIALSGLLVALAGTMDIAWLPDAAKFIGTLGAALIGVGLGHKIEKAGKAMILVPILCGSLLLFGCVSPEAKAAAHAFAKDIPTLRTLVIPAPLTPTEKSAGLTDEKKKSGVDELLQLLEENAETLDAELN